MIYTPEIKGSGEIKNGTAETIRRLSELGLDINTDYAFTIPEEKDEKNQVIKAESFWLRLPAPENQTGLLPVEGKIWFPCGGNNRDELIVFTPGYPSGKAGQWEQRLAKQLVEKDGYTLFVLRHNSASLNPDNPDAPLIYNCQKRIEDAREKGQEYLGPKRENGFNWIDLAREPLVVLKALGNLTKKIKVVGHSFGASSSHISLGDLAITNPEIVRKVTHFIGLSGYFGEPKETEEGLLHGTKFSLDGLAELELLDEKENGVNGIKDGEEMRQTIKQFASMIENSDIPEHITRVIIASPEDKFITSPVLRLFNKDGKELIQQRVYDLAGYEDKAPVLVIQDRTHEIKHHSLPNLRPETLSRVLEVPHPKTSHFVIVREKLPKSERERIM